jgi:hypothetical protein
MLASALLALATIALGSIGTTTVASAQVDTCCVRINNPTNCHISICARSANGPIHCETVYANSTGGFRFRCDLDDTHLAVVDDACGLDHRLRVGECVRAQLRGGCCVKVCLSVSHDGCFQVDVTPIDGPCDCP